MRTHLGSALREQICKYGVGDPELIGIFGKSRAAVVAECSRGGISGRPFAYPGESMGRQRALERENRRFQRRVFPRRAEPQRGTKAPTSVTPIERFHWALSGPNARCRLCRLQYRRATIYPISNHREHPLARTNYRPICCRLRARFATCASVIDRVHFIALAYYRLIWYLNFALISLIRSFIDMKVAIS